MVLGRDLKLVIFDFDGTLIHLDVDWTTLGRDLVTGRPDPAAATAAELAGLGDRRLDVAAMSVLAALGERYRLAVLSRNSREVVQRALADVAVPVMIVGREDCARPKPDPSGVRLILARLSVDPAQAVLVGDTYHDVEAAHAAGLPAVVVHNERLAYRPEGADRYLDSLADLLPLLTREDSVPDDLDRYLANYTGFNDWLIRARYALLRRYFAGASCLELGPATGAGTGLLLDHFTSVVAVDGSQQVVDNLTKRYPGLRTVCARFEHLDLDRTFDTVVLAHVLEHVNDPAGTLAVARRHLAPGGAMIVDVPNAMSLHRQVGVELGLLGAVTDLHAGDLSIGHQRVYTPEAFRREIEDAGLVIERFGGVFLKILSNAQSAAAFDADQLRALLAIGERYPEIAAEIYVVARVARA